MKKEHIIVIATLLIAMLFLSGCGGNKNTQETTPGNPFVGGTEGLSMTFIDQAPPSEVFDKKSFPFDVIVNVKNKGEYTILANQAKFSITSINPNLFGITQSDLTKYLSENLNKNSKITSGGSTSVEYHNLNYVPSIIGETQTNLIRVDSCYTYKTYAAADLCIKRPIQTQQKNPVCTIEGTKTVYNSGAPIHITQVKEAPIGSNKIQISFTISNVGAGDGFYDVKDGSCSGRTNENKIFVLIKPQETNLKYSCSGLNGNSGYITLYGGEQRTVVCTLDVTGLQGEYTSRLGFELSYNYLQHIDKTISVKSSSE